MAISISELRYFQKAAELQNITAAAAQLHVMQPSLSRSISSLEADLGVKLFDRVGRNIMLNHYGKIVKSYADRILAQLDSMTEELRDSVNQDQRTVAISLAAASTFMPALMTKYKKTHPDIRFDILQLDQRSSVEDQPYDLKLFTSSRPIDNDYTVTLFKERVLLAILGDDPRAGESGIRLSDFSTADFILLHPGTGLRNIADEYCRMAEFVPKVVLESDSPSTIREFIKAGYGVSFVPEITWSEVRGDNIALMPIESPKCNRYICLTWSHTGYLPDHVRHFKDFLVHNFEKHALAVASIISGGENIL